MTYLFDTNTVLGYIRQNNVAASTASILDITNDNDSLISVVTVGELWSIARRSGWGEPRRQELQQLLDTYSWVNVDNDALLYRYADIDAFSQNKLPGRSLNTTARNMGKNDAWRSAIAVAATASLLGATLLTTDKDFDHLHNQFVDVVRLDPLRTRKLNSIC